LHVYLIKCETTISNTCSTSNNYNNNNYNNNNDKGTLSHVIILWEPTASQNHQELSWKVLVHSLTSLNKICKNLKTLTFYNYNDDKICVHNSFTILLLAFSFLLLKTIQHIKVHHSTHTRIRRHCYICIFRSLWIINSNSDASRDMLKPVSSSVDCCIKWGCLEMSDVRGEYMYRDGAAWIAAVQVDGVGGQGWAMSGQDIYSYITALDRGLGERHSQVVRLTKRVIVHSLKHTEDYVLIERFKWRLHVPTNAGKHKTLHMCIANNKQQIQSSDWPKWHCALWHNINSRLLSDQK